MWLGQSCPSIECVGETPVPQLRGLDSRVQASTHGEDCPCYL
ncbi:MAG: hypothetical protein NZ556_00835 [Fimbriimonadales bacterium]|nr:hypothetical protein [Fimbriimonadales bacterium]